MINEIWEMLAAPPFFSSPKRGFYDGKRGFRILATRRLTPGQGWPLLLLRTSRRPCRQAAGHKARRPAVPVRGYRPFGVVWPHGWGQTKKGMRGRNRPACPPPRWSATRGRAPQPPGGRVGGVPPVVLFGLVPGRRFALAPPSPRGRKGGRARRPAPLGSTCGPGRGGLDSAACGRRGTAGGINASGWWIANERHP